MDKKFWLNIVYALLIGGVFYILVGDGSESIELSIILGFLFNSSCEKSH